MRKISYIRVLLLSGFVRLHRNMVGNKKTCEYAGFSFTVLANDFRFGMSETRREFSRNLQSRVERRHAEYTDKAVSLLVNGPTELIKWCLLIGNARLCSHFPRISRPYRLSVSQAQIAKLSADERPLRASPRVSSSFLPSSFGFRGHHGGRLLIAFHTYHIVSVATQ